jgi:HSP20 family protein
MVVPNVWLRTSSPLGTLNGARRQLERFLADYPTQISEAWAMPAEIVETADELRFAIELPGLRPEEIELTLENGVLTLSGDKKIEQREGETADNYRLAERRYGRHTRSFRLPGTVDTNRVQASCENGVLTIRLPRVEAAKPRRIPVAGAGETQQVTPRPEQRPDHVR